MRGFTPRRLSTGGGWPARRGRTASTLLALVAGQDVEPAEGSDGTDGRWRIARKVAEDRVISTVDPDARHTRKSPESRRDGYRAHVAAEPETGIITDEELTKAAGAENSDPAVAERFLAAETTRAADNDGSTREWYGDSAYGTGDLRDAIAKAEQVAVLKPKPLQPAVVGGFTVDDFTVDQAAGTVTCPNAITRPISATEVATFGALCRACPLRARCTTCKAGRKLVVGDHDALLRQARRDWAADPALRQAYRQHRPNVERVISQLAAGVAAGRGSRPIWGCRATAGWRCLLRQPAASHPVVR
jgi:Transposase DDE domain